MMKLLLLLAFVFSVQGGDNPDKCVDCKDPMFNGFGYKPTDKCGCCPWPCCCKCTDGEPEGPIVCDSLIDLAMILDASGSIGNADWEVAKIFAVDVASIFMKIGTDQLVSSVTFSTNATVNWDFNGDETADEDTLKASLMGLEKTGRFTNTAEALEKAMNQVFTPSGGDRPGVPNVSFLMTDGKNNILPDDVLSATAAQLRQKSKLLCIGVTNEVVMSELEDICDGPDNVFSVNDFEALQTILNGLQRKICPEPPKSEKCYCCCTPEQFFGAGGNSYYKW